MRKAFSKLAVILLASTLILSALTSIGSATVPSSWSYAPFINTQGVIEADRYDFMNADGNPLKEDIANAVFQGPGVFGSETVGFMKDIYLTLTAYGTLTKMNYTGEEKSPYHWLPVIEQNPAGINITAPLEGWAIAYNITAEHIGPVIQRDGGYLVVTYSGFSAGGAMTPSVIGKDGNDVWLISVVKETWVNNPRLLALFYNITALNSNSTYRPKFELDIIVIFNKATKFVEIFQQLKLKDIIFPTGCATMRIDMAMARMAIFDANPWCDLAFYGWKNVTIEDPEFFMVLSWTNSTLKYWVHPEGGYDYYGAYMLAYPLPESWAIASVIYDDPADPDNFVQACNVWRAPRLVGSLCKYVFLRMNHTYGFPEPDGDQALVRFEWDEESPLATNKTSLIGLRIPWKMVMYGVYDVNGESYDGGEGGCFRNGRLTLSNNTSYTGPKITWTHTGTLGWLNNPGENPPSNEAQLAKTVTRLDLNHNGTIDEDEKDLEFCWYPTEELYWQLTYKFAPPVFKKIPPSTCCLFSEEEEEGPYIDVLLNGQEYLRNQYDFMVLPAPGATPDAAGAAWLNARFTSMLVTFDVEAYNMTATVGYVNPPNKMLPYLMLRLEEIPPSVTENYPARRAHYLTADGRALPQMEWEDITDHCVTPWLDVHYMVVTVAGVHPNLVTYYFNDFTPIVRAVGGDYQWDIVVLPTVGPISVIPYTFKSDMGLGVIALAKDHFNNIALIVYGVDAQDTYWTAYYATFEWPTTIAGTYGCWQALLIKIDYTAIGNMWGDGKGVPTAHPTYPSFSIIACAREYESP